ncbi:MAG TPA: thrombospondin type 3 repeat-containing protein [Burkholderiales bacterium]|nr:thrombospondin type 3 repeat-containing protein [Burkholderiales bacterium]
MKKLAVLLIAIGSLLPGCIPIPYEGGGGGGGERHGDRDRDGVPNRADRDRDGDGVPNRQDSRPNDPRRY